MKVHILTIGDEILIGQTIDTNSAWLGQQLNLIGAEVVEISSISDDHLAIKNGLKHALSNADIVLMTGGLGPTKDDITKKAIADFFQVEMVFHQPTFERIQKFFERLGRPTTKAHEYQSFMPQNATILNNKMGTAPGMWFLHAEKVIVSMPGVPYEMKWIMENEVLQRLKDQFKPSPILHRTTLTSGLGESQIARILEVFENQLPNHIKLAYLPNLAQVKLRLTARGKDESVLKIELDQLQAKLVAILKDNVFGYENEELEGAIGKLLIEKKLTVSTAESCTGGYIAHKLTSIPGSSAYFWGSVVSYDNSIKISQLGVKTTTLEKYGAVSEQTVIEMAKGALKNLKTDLAIATSGIMGPGGGTEEKPVGTVWIGIGNASKIKTYKLTLGKNRLKNIEYTANFALDLLRKFVQGIDF